MTARCGWPATARRSTAPDPSPSRRAHSGSRCSSLRPTRPARTSTTETRDDMASTTVATASSVARSPWVDRAARLGFVARGVVYIIIGILALKIATGDPKQESADKQGALAIVARQPFGEVILVILAIGLGGYAAWRFSEAIWG